MQKIFTIAIAGILSFASQAMATPIAGLGLPTDDINLSGGTVIDFEGGPVNAPSLSLSGVTFTSYRNIVVDTVFAGNLNTRGQYYLNNFLPDGQLQPPAQDKLEMWFRFDFENSTDAFGFLLGASDMNWTLSAFDTNGLLEDMTILPVQSSNDGDYFGIAHQGISYAILSATIEIPGIVIDDYVFIDNFTYRNARQVPEPAPLALLGLGLIGLGLLKRRK